MKLKYEFSIGFSKSVIRMTVSQIVSTYFEYAIKTNIMFFKILVLSVILDFV
jgi:hypothetical protein